MITLGQLCLLGAFVASGYAAFACFAGWRYPHRGIGLSGDVAAVSSVFLLTVVAAILGLSLMAKDFRFAYVAQYSSLDLKWYYSLSALWVGQAGSLLCWAWMLGALALLYRFWPRGSGAAPLAPAFGVLMAYVCFLSTTMVFGADPMAPSLDPPRDGLGLSPLLQHPVMLVHPPIVLLGYAAWAMPFALAIGWIASTQGGQRHPLSQWRAGFSGQDQTTLAPFPLEEARRWALLAWVVSGGGILLGALWAYEELGWGGYWNWDPVENGSLIPWLVGTALIHALMAWRFRGVLKKTSLVLAVATFGLCNFATFLTRSGFFSSLHAFSESPVGWMFLAAMLGLAVMGGVLIWMRRGDLSPHRPIRSVASREALMLLCILATVLLAIVVLFGTLSTTLSKWMLGHAIVVGPSFYNRVLMPLILLVLAGLGAAPISRWGKGPTAKQRQNLLRSVCAGAIPTILAFAQGVHRPFTLAVIGLTTLAAVAALGTLRRPTRRQAAGALIHLGFLCLVIGVTGSSRGSRRHEVVLREGQSITWAGRSIRLVRLTQQQQPDRIVASAELEISRDGAVVATLAPAKHLYRHQNEWTTEVAIHSSWAGDLYTLVQGPAGPGKVALTLIENPLIRWLWLGGLISTAGAIVGLWPGGRKRAIRQMPMVESQSSLAA